MQRSNRQAGAKKARIRQTPVLQAPQSMRPTGIDSALLHLDMQITNFGPIKRAAISLRPLTILIGPSNTGKSYAAMLVHSIISSGRGTYRHRAVPVRTANQKTVLDKLAKDMRNMLLSLQPEKTYRCPLAMSERIMQSCRRGLQARLESEIELNFASPLQDIVRNKTNHFSIVLENSGKRVMSYGGKRLTMGSVPMPTILFQPTKVDDGNTRLNVSTPDDKTVHCRVDRNLIASNIGLGMSWRLYELIEDKALPQMIPGLPVTDFYFPAARTGVLQAHRAISSAIINSAPYGGIEGIQVPRLSGVVSDFVSAIIDMYPVPGPYFDIGNQIESDIFGGHVGLKYSDQRTVPDIVYRHSGSDVPIHRVSSTISELAPFTLYLKHIIRHGGMLVVEEPEAHLHPSNQLRLAAHIVRLVRNGINVMITTHSATLLEAISQYVEISPMRRENRKRALGVHDLYIHPDEVATHLFAPDDGDGAVAKKIAVSAEDGIPQDEFIKVDQLLNENNIRIEEYSE